MSEIKEKIAAHQFEDLFIDTLGWDRFSHSVKFKKDNNLIEMQGIAQKRGFPVFHCSTYRTVLANRFLLRDSQKELRKTHHEHILIYSSEVPPKQVWQWATSFGDGRKILHREHPFFSNDPPASLLNRLEGLVISFESEEKTTFSDILIKVREALQPENDFNLFARNPYYLAESDRLAIATKRGDPGALQSFVLYHINLTKFWRNRLIHVYRMDSEDAEQIATIGLIEASKRFDPDRGFQFSTYANHWMRQAYQRLGKEWPFRLYVPEHISQKCQKIFAFERNLITTYGPYFPRNLLEDELKNEGLTLFEWSQFNKAINVVVFTDLNKKEKFEILCKKDRQKDDFSQSILIHEVVAQALKSIHPRLANIICRRYGIGHNEATLQEIADSLSLTRERVRQLQVAAENKLRRFFKGNQLTKSKKEKINKKKEKPQRHRDVSKTKSLPKDFLDFLSGWDESIRF